VIYGDPLAAGRLFFTLDHLGLGYRASLLDGGLPGWKAAGLTLTSEVPPPSARGRIEPRIQSAVLIDAAELSRRLHDSTLAVVDARPPAEWSGATPGDGVLRPGHIPGARSFFWRLTLTPGEPAYLKDAAVLRKLLGRAGAAPGREVITYCRTGVQASYL
jgi:thiosulfate/3-mercaptopyruvate sulfurtransferase